MSQRPGIARHVLSAAAIALLVPLALAVTGGQARAADGDPDTSWNGSGDVVVNASQNGATREAATFLSDGRIVQLASRTLPGETAARTAFIRLLASGAVDTSFGSQGVLVLAIGRPSSSEYAGIVAAGDGSVFAAFNGFSGGNSVIQIVKLTPAGALDATFGTGGIATMASAGFTVSGLVVQPDGRPVVAGYRSAGGMTAFRLTTAGALDTTFGTAGFAPSTASGAEALDSARAVGMLPDGRILLARGAASPSSTLRVSRLLANGQVDTAFGTAGGTNAIVPGGGFPDVRAVAVRGDGAIVVVSETNAQNIAVTRFTAAGFADATFGNAGWAFASPFVHFSKASSLVLPPDGGVVVLAGGVTAIRNYSTPFGTFAIPDRTKHYLVRFQPNGTLDAAFGTGGIAEDYEVSGPLETHALRLQADGKLVAVSGSGYGFVFRREANGAADTGFGLGGATRTTLFAADETANAIARQADGKVLTAGSTFDGARIVGVVSRFESYGVLDDTFATPGVSVGEPGTVRLPLGNVDSDATAIAVQPDGRILVAGSAKTGATFDLYVARLLATGAPDTTFGTGGATVIPIAGTEDFATSIGLQSDGRIIVGGTSFGAASSGVVARLTTGGALDTTFGVSGLRTVDWGTGDDAINALVVQPDNRIVVAGSTHNGSNFDFALARLDANGALDATFGTAGKTTTAITGNDVAHGLARQSDGKLVAAGSASASIGDSNFALARYTTAGVLDTTFSTDGKVTTSIGAGPDVARAVAVQADGAIVAAGYSNASGSDRVVLARYAANGNLDTTFGVSGIVLPVVTGQSRRAHALAIGPDGRLLVAGESFDGTDKGQLAMRFVGDGVVPTVASIALASPNFTSTASISFTVTFSEAVTGVDAADFALTTTGTVAGAAITGVSGTGATRSVTINRGTGSGSIRLDVLDNDTIVDGGSNPLNGTGTGSRYTAGPIFTVFDPVRLVTTTLPALTVGTPASATLVAADGLPPYTYGVAAAALPSGLSLDPETGAISGTPTAAGNFLFQLGVSDDSGAFDTNAFNVAVAQGAQAITFAALPDRAIGSGTSSLVATGGGSGLPVTFASLTPSVCTASGTNSTTLTLLAIGACTIRASQAGNANWLAAANVDRSFSVLASTMTLTVGKTGSGTVTSNPGGIDCGAMCSAAFPGGTAVTLTATAAGGSTFTGWSGACTGTGTCQVTMDAAKSVTATFTASQFVLTVVNPAPISGRVQSTPGGIDCGIALICSDTFATGTVVTLTASPSPNFFFAGWTGGGCSGTAPCQVTMDAARTVSAEFKRTSTIPRLANISTRMQVLTGNDVLIGGFIIGGTQPKTVVVRARGPSLIPFGITNALLNPTMQLFSGQTVLATSDDWGTAANAAAISSSGFAPSSAQESAILTTLGPGAYTAVVSGVGGTTGVGIIEVFEVDKPEVPLANISTRGQVLTGNDVMIGGFVIQGDSPQTVTVRARGPSLIPFGITNALADPVLELFNGATLVATNDDWQSSADAAAISASGFAPSDPKEAVIRITLPPGAYTAIVRGKNGGTGVGIIEAFAQ